MTVHDLLVTARSYVDTPAKWTKRQLFGGRGTQDTCCIAGALLAALPARDLPRDGVTVTDEDRLHEQAVDRMAACLPAGECTGSYNIERLTRWNDDEETVHADVLALFDAAIKEEETDDDSGD